MKTVYTKAVLFTVMVTNRSSPPKLRHKINLLAPEEMDSMMEPAANTMRVPANSETEKVNTATRVYSWCDTVIRQFRMYLPSEETPQFYFNTVT